MYVFFLSYLTQQALGFGNQNTASNQYQQNEENDGPPPVTEGKNEMLDEREEVLTDNLFFVFKDFVEI